MVFLDELKSFKLYKRVFITPIVEADKRKGSLIYLLTPNEDSSCSILKHKLIKPRYFTSLYIERKSTMFLSDNGTIKEESALFDNEEVSATISELICPIDEGYINDNFLRVHTDDANFVVALNENSKYDSKIKKILWNDRLKTIKDLNAIYADIKTKVPYITRTFYDIDKYKGWNLFVDLSFYLSLFTKNNTYKLDNGMKLYEDFIARLLNNGNYAKAGYSKKTIFIDYFGWKKECGANSLDELMDWKKHINPISMLYYMMKKTHTSFNTIYKDSIDIVFMGKDGWLKMNSADLTYENLNQFKMLMNRLDNNDIDDEDMSSDSPKVIVMQSIEKIEKATGIIIDNIKPKNLVGDIPEPVNAKSNRTPVVAVKKPEKIVKAISQKQEREIKEKIADDTKAELVDKINDIASDKNSADEVIDYIDQDEHLAKIIQKISQNSKTTSMSSARKAHIEKLSHDFLRKTINKKTINDMLEDSKKIQEIPEAKINIDSINDEWKHMRFVNFNKNYDPNDDIVAILNFLGTLSHPISIVDLKVEDTTTSDDMKYTYKAVCETETGKRFNFVFDIPKIKDGRFMKLRGNDKTLNNQLVLLPIVKTDDDTVQLVSNYKKIFVRRYGTTVGKSSGVADRLIKALLKYEGNAIQIKKGDCSRLCHKYNVTFEYKDIASVIQKIETKNRIFYLNPDELIATYKITPEEIIKKSDENLFPLGYDKQNKVIIWTSTKESTADHIIANLIDVEGFSDLVCSQMPATKYCYSMASILNTEIPVIVILGYGYGLNKIINNVPGVRVESNIPPRKDIRRGFIKFNDGCITFDNFGPSGFLLNGLKDCPTEEYSLADINDKAMWLDFLDEFGGRIKADGLDNFQDLFVDPKTKVICDAYGLPNNYFDMLMYTNVLLCSNEYNKHVDLTGNRFRSNELIAGYAYYCISTAYGMFANSFKRKNTATMTMKQSAILDAILEDPTCSDLSTETPLLENETASAVGFKGLSGLNTDRAYSLDKRTFDDSMVNKLALSTGFAENVGITRQATIDMDIKNNIGTLGDQAEPDDMSITKTFSMTEAMNPFTATRDDPFRMAMTFVQSSKHTMRTAISHPLLVTNGADEAITYLTSDTFAWKSKGKGTIIEKTDDYMVVQYEDGQPNEFIDLRETVKKNSDGGFFLTIKLDTDLQVGDKVKPGEILAYDHTAYSDIVGATDNIAATPGILAKIAIPMTEEGYEDSTIVTQYLARALESEVVIKKEKVIQKDSNIYYLAKKGMPIQEGDPILIFQNAYDDNDVNILLKNLSQKSNGDVDAVSELGRITIKSHYTGIIQDVQILRTCEVSEMSESMQKIVKEYESNVTKYRRVMAKYKTKDSNSFTADYKLPATGSLKDCPDGIKIIIYIKYFDKMSVGDKIVNWAALKGVVKTIPPKGKEMYSEYRPNEEVSSMFSMNSVNARMVSSIQLVGAIDKGLIELDRQVKEIMGLPWKTIKEYDEGTLDKIEEKIKK